MIAPVDVTGIRIETPRLILRPWQAGDLADLYEYAKVDGVGQMAGWQPHESMETSQKILTSFLTQKKTLALELKETGHVIGSLGFETPELPDMDPELTGREFGYVLSRDYWGQGLMPEAVQAAMAYCFETLNWDYICCAHFLWNHQSRRVIEKNGFVFLKELTYQTQIGTVETTRFYICHNPNKGGTSHV